LKILLLNQCFYPDVVSTAQHLTDLAAALTSRGHEVTVIASDRGYDDPRTRFQRRERWNGIEIVRIPSLSLGKNSRWRRGLNFGSFLVVLLYVLVPWTSVNLVDYYFVRRGHYAVGQIFVPNGIYGNWGWRGLTAYAIGIVAMIPFVVTAWYVGPIAQAMGGADVALFAGLAASAVAYLILARSLDLDAERKQAKLDTESIGVESVSFGSRR